MNQKTSPSNNGNGKHIYQTRQYWDKIAASFDDEADHGLTDPTVRQAWKNLLQVWLPPTPANILDVGCGTGSLSILMAALGYEVVGIDNAPAMIIEAQKKANATDIPISFYVMEATDITFAKKRFDAIVCRHLLWLLSDLKSVLRHWTGLLEENGRFLFIEGQWQTGGGLSSDDILAAFPSALTNITVQELSSQSDLWGKTVTDKRYAVIAEKTD